MVRKRASDQFLLEKTSWAGQIAEKDSDYRDYAGCPFELGEKLVKVDMMLKLLPQNHPFIPFLKLRRMYLMQLKKAYVSGERAGELSVLGFLKGAKTLDIKAKLDAIDI